MRAPVRRARWCIHISAGKFVAAIRALSQRTTSTQSQYELSSPVANHGNFSMLALGVRNPQLYRRISFFHGHPKNTQQPCPFAGYVRPAPEPPPPTPRDSSEESKHIRTSSRRHFLCTQNHTAREERCRSAPPLWTPYWRPITRSVCKSEQDHLATLGRAFRVLVLMLPTPTGVGGGGGGIPVPCPSTWSHEVALDNGVVTVVAIVLFRWGPDSALQTVPGFARRQLCCRGCWSALNRAVNDD